MVVRVWGVMLSTQISGKTLLFTSKLFTRMHRETHCNVMLDQISDIVTSSLP